MPSPLVSICIPTYNGADFIEETIRSALDQSYDNLEVCVFDDNSTDNTQAIVSAIDDPRLKYRRNKKNLGPKGNWNLCLGGARGEYFKLLPHDDVLPRTAVQKQVEIFEKDSEKAIALVVGKADLISVSSKRLMTRSPLGKQSRRIKGPSLINRCIASGRNIIGEPGNGLIRTELIRVVGEYDDEFPYAIDLNYWFRVLEHGDAYYLASVTSGFRVHPNAWTHNLGWKQYRDFIGLIEKFSASPNHDISWYSRNIGKLRVAINTPLRRLAYSRLTK